MKKTALALTTSAVLLLSACGGGGGGGGGLSDDEQTVADNISKNLAAEGESFSVTQAEADCAAEDMVAGVGVEKMQEYGIVNDDLTVNKNPDDVKMSTADAETAADAFLGCVDVATKLKDELSKQFAGQPPAVKKCVEGVLTEERLRGLLVSTFSGDQEGAQAELIGPLTECAQKAIGG